MLKALVRVRFQSALESLLRAFGQGKKKAGLGRKLLFGLLFVYLFATLSFAIGFLFHTLFVTLPPMGYQWLVFAQAYLTAFALSLVGSVFLTQAHLYEAKDNELLLALPIKPRTILASRLLTLWLINLALTLFTLLPVFVVWLMTSQVSFAAALIFWLIAFLVPFLSLTFSCVLGWALGYLGSRLRYKNLVITVLGIVFLGLYFYGFYTLQEKVKALLLQGSELAVAIKNALPPAYTAGMAVSQASLVSVALVALWCLLPFLAVTALISLNYQRILTTRRGCIRVQYKARPLKQSGQTLALIKKELCVLTSSPMYMLNNGVGLILMLALPVFVIVSPGTLQEAFSQFGALGIDLGLLAMLALCFLSSTVIFSSASLSLEGKQFWQVQVLPISPAKVLLSKALMHLLISLPVVLGSSLALCVLLKPAGWMLLYLLALPSLITVVLAFLGVLVNLRFPKLHWNTQTEAIKQSMSPFLTMLAGMSLTLVPILLFALVFSNITSLTIFLGGLTVLYALLAFLLLRLIMTRGEASFLRLSER